MILNYTKISYKIPRGFIAAKKRIEVSLDALLRLFAVCHVSCGSFFHNPASALFFADFSQRRNPLRFGKSVCCSDRSLRSDSNIASSGLCRLFDGSDRFEGQVGIVFLSVNQHIAAYLIVIGDAALEALAVDVVACGFAALGRIERFLAEAVFLRRTVNFHAVKVHFRAVLVTPSDADAFPAVLERHQLGTRNQSAAVKRRKRLRLGRLCRVRWVLLRRRVDRYGITQSQAKICRRIRS